MSPSPTRWALPLCLLLLSIAVAGSAICGSEGLCPTSMRLVHQQLLGYRAAFCVDDTGTAGGDAAFWRSTGTLAARAQYWHGVLNGHWTYHDSVGRELQEGSYWRGDPDGFWRYWNHQGQLIRVEIYRGGQGLDSRLHESLERIWAAGTTLRRLSCAKGLGDDDTATRALHDLEDLDNFITFASLDADGASRIAPSAQRQALKAESWLLWQASRLLTARIDRALTEPPFVGPPAPRPQDG